MENLDQCKTHSDMVLAIHKADSYQTILNTASYALQSLLRTTGFAACRLQLDIGPEQTLVTATSDDGEHDFDADCSACYCAAETDRLSGITIISKSLKKRRCAGGKFKALAVAPIVCNGKKFGFFVAGSKSGNKPEDLSVVTSTLEHLAVALKRISELDSANKKASDLETVHQVGSLVTGRLTLKEMVREVVKRLGAVLATDEVNVTLYDENRKELSFLARYFADDTSHGGPEVYPLSDGMNSYIVNNRTHLLMKRDTEEECRKLGIRHGGIPAKSWLGAPMIYKDRVVGTLSVQSYNRADLYDERSVELLSIVAGQCAVAVENAKLFEEVIRREAEKEKLYFSLTHDLLSLLNPVAGYAKLLKTLPEKTGREKYESLADQIIISSDKITRFVEDILVWGKIQSGKLTLNIERADVVAVAVTVLTACLPELYMRKIAVTLNGALLDITGNGLSDVTNERVMADFDVAQMERVFLNLVGNGVKHSRSMIDIEVAEEDSSVTCSVKDDGEGVRSELIPLLFEEYYQTDNNSAKGVGLGLPTVKRIVELHQGRILVGSKPGEGFHVSFRWPRTLADRAPL